MVFCPQAWVTGSRAGRQTIDGTSCLGIAGGVFNPSLSRTRGRMQPPICPIVLYRGQWQWRWIPLEPLAVPDFPSQRDCTGYRVSVVSRSTASAFSARQPRAAQSVPTWVVARRFN